MENGAIVAPRRVLFAVTLAAIALRLYGIWFGWPEVVHPDEPRIIARAMRMLETGDFNPHFFTYPSLYLLYVSFVFAWLGVLTWPLHLLGVAPDLFAWYREQPALFHALARAGNAAMGAATVPLVYAACVRLTGSRTAALVAAAALALNPLHVQESHFATTDVPAAALATASFYFAAGVYRTGSLRDHMLAGALAGLAAAAKYPAGLVILALPVAAVLRVGLHARGARAPDGPLQTSGVREDGVEVPPPRSASTSGSGLWRLAIGLLVCLDLFFVAMPFAAIDPRAVLDDLLTEWIATRAGILGATIRDPLYYVSLPGPPVGTGTLGLLAAVLGGVVLARRQPEALPLVLAGGLPLLVVVSAAVIKIDRYVLLAVPVMSVLIGVFAERALSWVVSKAARVALAPGGRAPARAGAVPIWAPVLAAGAIMLLPGREAFECVASLGAPDPRQQAAAWMRANLAPGSIVGLPAHGWMGPRLEGGALRPVPIPHAYDDRVRERIGWEQTVRDGPAGALLAALLPRRIHTPAMAERRLATLPAIGSTGAPPLAGVTGVYIVESEAFTEIYELPYTGREHPQHTTSWLEFIEEVRSRGELVQQWPGHNPSCSSFLRAPGLRLYRL